MEEDRGGHTEENMTISREMDKETTGRSDNGGEKRRQTPKGQKKIQGKRTTGTKR